MVDVAEFKKVKIKVTSKHVKDHYQFTEEEFEKFIKLSKQIDETTKLHETYLLSDNLTFYYFSLIIKLLHLIFVFGQCLSLPDTFFYLIFKDQ